MTGKDFRFSNLAEQAMLRPTCEFSAGLPSGVFQMRYRDIGLARSTAARNEGCGLIAPLIQAVRWGRAYSIPAPVSPEAFHSAMVRLAADSEDGTAAFNALGFDVLPLGLA
ncbi:Uncharacterised protein [Mycobacteroides abscessus subsp. abscessus]|uniref:hypothetical protein n=1 Tax=Mycobacteroides abscessus TaxID=36809 RepID=UPI000929DA6B|nr:hypothetical protein [Mycobacteroides abscessus]SIC51384.1 Uncharacterised protein [Mycobacteroides abscessus subsp. abscessus]SID08318.1 Uncharacterised protein [Mycobacteroides abscessus subsp. abscessus]SID35366.1 Uncharacterised protein [Mycobacteroides abscessus subsp. abscessus]SID40240.1 Uncharacterised protein [Mycobacteroides abscessus subsp. abscessus]SKT66312.1 Uncharacterised protein [Mycobacteroides abscessus subsp. abscessus]